MFECFYMTKQLYLYILLFIFILQVNAMHQISPLQGFHKKSLTLLNGPIT